MAHQYSGGGGARKGDHRNNEDGHVLPLGSGEWQLHGSGSGHGPDGTVYAITAGRLYALGTRPAFVVPETMLLHAVAGWAFYFLRECADLTYRVEASLDLENWSHVVTDAGLVGGKVAVPEVGSRSFLRLRMY